MPEVSDVELMELADGALVEPRRQFVEVELARRPELQQRLAVFRVTGKALGRLFDPVMEASLPPTLIETIRHGGSARALHLISEAAPARKPGRFADALSVTGWRFSSGMAWAATVAAVVGLGAVFWSLRSDSVSGLAAAPLALALQTTPSDQSAGLVLPGYGPGVLKPDLSFQHVDGRYCRQYEVSFATGSGLVGYACSAGNGGWRIEKEVEMAPAKVDQPGVIRPAGPHPNVKAIDDAVDGIIRGDALETDKVLALIRSGWPLQGKQ